MLGITMTTEVKVLFENDLYRPNEILDFQSLSEVDPQKIHLKGTSFESRKKNVDEPLSSVCKRVSKSAIDWITSNELLREKSIYIFISHACWLDRNPINMYKKLWKSFSSETKDIKTDDFPEIAFSNKEGNKVKFAGLLPVEIKKFDYFAEIVRTMDSTFMLIGDMNITEKTIIWLYNAAFLESDNKIVNFVNWHRLCQKVCNDRTIVVRVAGRFDDREASVDLFHSINLVR